MGGITIGASHNTELHSHSRPIRRRRVRGGPGTHSAVAGQTCLHRPSHTCGVGCIRRARVCGENVNKTLPKCLHMTYGVYKIGAHQTHVFGRRRTFELLAVYRRPITLHYPIFPCKRGYTNTNGVNTAQTTKTPAAKRFERATSSWLLPQGRAGDGRH